MTPIAFRHAMVLPTPNSAAISSSVSPLRRTPARAGPAAPGSASATDTRWPGPDAAHGSRRQAVPVFTVFACRSRSSALPVALAGRCRRLPDAVAQITEARASR